MLFLYLTTTYAIPQANKRKCHKKLYLQQGLTCHSECTVVYYKCIVMIDRKVFFMEYITHSPEETEALGAEYAKSLKAGDVVAFSGDLGAGKTAFTRGVLHGLGYEGRVTSPTFAIANEYETPTVKVAHFDLYRILDSEALFEIGFDEYLDGSRIVLIEWSENAADVLPEAYKTVHIAYGDADNDRRITIGEVTGQ